MCMCVYVYRFDIRLMKWGRMRNQAFIGLPSVEAAVKAVEEMNGYKLHGRPMVVVSGVCVCVCVCVTDLLLL